MKGSSEYMDMIPFFSTMGKKKYAQSSNMDSFKKKKKLVQQQYNSY